MKCPSEFSYSAPTAWRGFTTPEAADFLRTHIPGESQWMVWTPSHSYVRRLLRPGGPDHGAAGPWHWQHTSCPYPHLFYYTESSLPEYQTRWTGLVEVTTPDQRRFHLFAYLNAAGEVGNYYMVSTTDIRLLEGFSDALRRQFAPAGRIVVTVPQSEDIYIDGDSQEHLCLQEAMRLDIERQALGFFVNEQNYRDMGIPHRRGLLFVGPPGCGKTLTIRHLIRKIHRQAAVSCWALRTQAYLCDDNLVHFFTQARRWERSVVVIEDIERIASTDSELRPTLLNQMDGLASHSGLLILATTNHPEKLDPAIAKRPSRFDRTWVFTLPDEALRRDYLRATLNGLGDDLVSTTARRTTGWSFALLNELRITAAMLAMHQNASLDADHVNEALDVLGRQFKAARDGFKAEGQPENMGFNLPA